jgi:hypothetical protein
MRSLRKKLQRLALGQQPLLLSQSGDAGRTPSPLELGLALCTVFIHRIMLEFLQTATRASQYWAGNDFARRR